MQNPLVVSDLDGTLLNSRKSVGETSVELINRFVAEGGLFTVATARMPYGAARRVAALDLTLPAIVMNGAALYNFAEARYGTSFPLDGESLAAVGRIIELVDAGAFAYALDDEQLHVAHRRDADLRFTQYYSGAALEADVRFVPSPPTRWAHLGTVIYVAVVGSATQLDEVVARCAHLPRVRTIRYENVYTGTICVELASIEAGKENALKALRTQVPADGLIAFGDGLNDVDMMRMADLSFAPRTADAAALAVADVIIGSNDEDAVALEIKQRFMSGGGRAPADPVPRTLP